MKKELLTILAVILIAFTACKGNGSTSTSSDGAKADSVDLTTEQAPPVQVRICRYRYRW